MILENHVHTKEFAFEVRPHLRQLHILVDDCVEANHVRHHVMIKIGDYHLWRGRHLLHGIDLHPELPGLVILSPDQVEFV